LLQKISTPYDPVSVPEDVLHSPSVRLIQCASYDAIRSTETSLETYRDLLFSTPYIHKSPTFATGDRTRTTGDPAPKSPSITDLPPELGNIMVHSLDSYDEYLALKETCRMAQSWTSMVLRPTLDRQRIRSQDNMFSDWSDVHIHLNWDENLISHNDWCRLKEVVKEPHRLCGAMSIRTLEVDVVHTLR
jgi:hypothetical protein